MRKLLPALAALAAAAAFAVPALAQYKWVDKDGRVRYGDTPPPGVKATPLRAPPGAAAPAAPQGDAKPAAAPLSPAEQEAAFRKRQIDAQKEREKQEKAARLANDRKENCQIANENLRTYESGARVSRTDANGERYFLDEAQMAEGLARARKNVQDWCS